jgi:hypothetical protein
MAEYNGPAALIQDGSEVEVTCFYFIVNDAQPRWWGTYADPDPAGVLVEGLATLRLPGGHEGQVQIDETASDPERGKFAGIGTLPELI